MYAVEKPFADVSGHVVLKGWLYHVMLQDHLLIFLLAVLYFSFLVTLQVHALYLTGTCASNNNYIYY